MVAMETRILRRAGRNKREPRFPRNPFKLKADYCSATLSTLWVNWPHYVALKKTINWKHAEQGVNEYNWFGEFGRNAKLILIYGIYGLHDLQNKMFPFVPYIIVFWSRPASASFLLFVFTRVSKRTLTPVNGPMSWFRLCILVTNTGCWFLINALITTGI